MPADNGMSRREFLLRSTAAGMAGAATLAVPKAAMAAEPAPAGTLGTFIDLTKCIGCGACTEACTLKNENRYPEPVDDIPVNWPTGKYEDWSEKRDLKDRFTPYNWTFVETVELDGGTLNVPRKCMHCDNPPCANLCPFSVQEKTASGAVVINEKGCMGGAKCRDVCPWEVPQRQAGVGIYMNLAPGLVGGGVMYKCDMCVDLVQQGGQPACVSACPTGAQRFGPKDQMKALAEARAAEIGGHIYGAAENGGTSTFYVSPVPFAEIDAAIAKRKAELPEPMQKAVPGMAPDVENYLDTAGGLATSYAIAPIAGVAAAGWAAAKAWKGGSE